MTSRVRFLMVLVLAVLIFPLGAWFATGGPRADRSQVHYMMAIEDARETRLMRGRAAETRFVLIGGSGLGWGMSARTLSAELGLPVVNLGLHGGLGYRAAYEAYADLLDPARDVLVVSPEYELIRIDQPVTAPMCAYLFVARKLSWDAVVCGVRNAHSRLMDTLYSAIGSTRVDEVYHREGFNDWGDYTRFYDATSIGLERPGAPLSLAGDADAIARYVAFLQGLMDVGFAVIYQPVTVAQMACDGIAPAHQLALHQRLSGPAFSRFDATFPFCAPDDLFYNTVYHPLGPMVDLKTDFMADTLRAWLERTPKSGNRVSE